MSTLLVWVTMLIGFLIVYHHIGYPLILKKLSIRYPSGGIKLKSRKFEKCEDDSILPSIHLIMPALNEEATIAEKINNIAAIDYPEDKLAVSIICDGCNDNTAKVARETIKKFICRHLRVEVIEHRKNRGKVSIINEAVGRSSSQIIALSDVSALISIDALLIAAEHFKSDNIGVVSGSYAFLNSESTGEETYWHYQTAIKKRESNLGSTLGVHGAFYLFRRHLFSPLEEDTINDDFVLPMKIVENGYRAIYEPDINAVELEQVSVESDFDRRRRIAAGNVQQFVRLWRLIHPKYGGIAFNFISGKGLRILMPFCLLFFFISSLYLAMKFWLFVPLLLSQVIVYGIALYRHITMKPETNKYAQTIYYIVSGYVASFIGIIRFCSGKEKGRWKRIS